MALCADAECSSTATYGEHKHDFDRGTVVATQNPSPHDGRLEPTQTGASPTEEAPRWIKHKFDPNGRVQPFPGNTIICHLSADGELYRALSVLYNELATGEFGSSYALLPPASWHMTVFEGVCDQIRKPGLWPGDLPLDAPLTVCNALFGQKLSICDLGSEPPFRMAIDGWEPLEKGISLRVVPASSAEEARLRQLRDRVSELLQIRSPAHDTYVFHVSMAYVLRRLNPQEYQKIWSVLHDYRPILPDVFELGALEFCTFDNMFAYHRQFFLNLSQELKPVSSITRP